MNRLITLEEFAYTNSIIIVAHRGASGSAPENTIPAFSDAIEAGADMIEADVQFTSDEEMVIFHDRIASQFKKTVDMLNYEQIKTINLAQNQYEEPIHIPHLKELIELLIHKTYLMIELKKSNEKEQNLIKLVNLVKAEDYIPYTLFASFHYENLLKLKVIDSTLHLATIKIPGDSTLPSVLSSRYGTRAYICSCDELNETINEDANRNGIFLGVYTVDSKDELIKALKYNIKAIGTNYPAKIKDLLGQLI